jgi:hypothetical protein
MKRIQDEAIARQATHQAGRAGAAAEQSVEAALDALSTSRDTSVLSQALDTLADSDAVPVEALLEFSRRAEEPELRLQALQMLSGRQESDGRVRRALQDAARSDRDDDVRRTARALLRQMEQGQ